MIFGKVVPIHRSRSVAEQIMKQIYLAKMDIGDKLSPERELAKSMEVGRNTLREAIAILQVAKIVEVKRSTGIFIASLPSEDDFKRQLSDAEFSKYTDTKTAINARIAMEPGVAILASKNATDQDWEKLNTLISDMRCAVDQGDVEEYRKKDNDLHKAIALAAHNSVIDATLLSVIDTARQPIWRAIKQNVYNASVLHASFEEHQKIIEAMRSQDEYFIFRAVTKHLENSKKRLGR